MIKNELKLNKVFKIFFGAVFVFVLYSAFYILYYNVADAASLNFSPVFGTYSVGRTFSVSVFTSSTDQAMNAAEANITYSSDKLRVVSVSQAGTIIDHWVEQPSFSNGTATVVFSGIDLNPGYQGSFGRIVTINFRATRPGVANVNFRSGAVLANDGEATNIISGLGGAKFTLVEALVTQFPQAPNVSSSTHPDMDTWYANKNPKLEWEVPEYIAAISYLISGDPSTNPEFTTEEIISKIEYEDLEDGIWYFHINFKNEFGWGDITHRKILIDTEPPEKFDISVIYSDNHVHVVDYNLIGEDESTIQAHRDPKPGLIFKTDDALSGVNYYEIKIGDEDIFSAAWCDCQDYSYTIPLRNPGRHPVSVWAVDNAGNKELSRAEIFIEPWAGGLALYLKLILIFSFILVVVLLLIILLIVYRFHIFRARMREYINKHTKVSKKEIEKELNSKSNRLWNFFNMISLKEIKKRKKGK